MAVVVRANHPRAEAVTLAAPTVRAYTFDAAMTLFEVYPSVGAVYAEVAARFDAHADAAALDAAFHRAWRERKPTDAHTSESDEWQWWHRTVRRTFELAGALNTLDGQFDAFFEVVYARFDEASAWRLYEDAIPTLTRLKDDGYPLAIVSNFDSRLHTVIANLGLAPFFDRVVISAAAGVRKPDRAIFLQACRELGVDPSETCHIGDSIEEDYEGALAAGLQARLLKRGGDTGDGIVTSLDALPL